MEKYGHVGVLMGGCSSEREISLKSGSAVYAALKDAGCRVSPIDIVSIQEADVIRLLQDLKIDVAFIALHGQFGEDGVIQAILEKINIPYSGSDVEASRLAINKVATQELLKSRNVPVADYVVVQSREMKNTTNLLKIIKKFPVVVKPANQGSSVGITLVESPDGLLSALEEAFLYDKEVLVERYIKGRELTVGILDQTALPIIEIRSKSKFFDFVAKYQSVTTQYLIPASLPQEISTIVQAIALQAYHALGCRDLSRVDIMLNDEYCPYVLEVNTIPGFTATSLLPKAAKAVGIDFTQLCLKIVELACRRAKKDQHSFAQ